MGGGLEVCGPQLNEKPSRPPGDWLPWWATQQRAANAAAAAGASAAAGGEGVKQAWNSPKRKPGPEPAAGAAGGGDGPPLTGNSEVDAEILAFYKAREGLVAQRMAGVRR